MEIALHNFTATPDPDAYAAKYQARSRFFQTLGRAGQMLAEAYCQADGDNQSAIEDLIIVAMLDALRAHEGYRDADVSDVISKLTIPT